MNYKRIAKILLLSMLIESSSVLGAELTINEVKINTETVTVSGVLSGEKNKDVLLYVAKSDTERTKDDIIYIVQATTNDSGAFEVEFEVNEDNGFSDGISEFVVYANSEAANSEVEKTFNYVGTNSRNSFISAINLATTSDEVYSAINSNTDVCTALGISLLTDVSTELFNSRPATGYTKENIVESINSLVFVKLINSATNSDSVKNYFEIFKDLINARNKDAETLISEVVYQNKLYENIDKLNEQYDKGNALNTINYSTRETMEKHITDNAVLLGYSNNENYLSFVGSTNVEKKAFIVKSIVIAAANTFKSSDDVVAAIGSALSQWEEQNTNDNSQHGGNNSSGDRGGGFAIPSPQVGQNLMNAVNSSVFSDVSDSFWAKTAIEALNKKGIVSGYEGKFRPNDNVTREEFATMAVKAFGVYNENAECDFIDVSKDKWYYRYVASAYENGIINGRNDGYFGSGEMITREDAAVILSRIIGEENGVDVDFTDKHNISAYALSGVATMQNKGIINGMEDGSFMPKNKCTRAEAATMIYRLMEGGIN